MLTDARTAAGLSQRDVARKLDINQSLVSRWESGERTPDTLQVAGYLAIAEVTGAPRDAILAFASSDLSATSWLAVGLVGQDEQLKALLRLEQDARQVVIWSPLMVSGLLQTSAYARAMMRDAGVPDDEVALRVTTRVGRADVLHGPNPLHLTALVSEAVLRQRIGGPHVMADQFDHLTKMAGLENVDIRIVPLETGWHPGHDGGFVVIDVDDTTAAVYLENLLSGVFLQDPEYLAAYKRAAERVLQVAFDADQSAAMIAAEAERIRT